MGGKFDQIKGRLKEAAGVLTDDDNLKREEKLDQVVGKVKEKAERVADTMKDALTGNRSTTRPPAHRSRSPQPVPAGSVRPVSADREPWYAQLSGGSMLPAQFFSPQTNLSTVRPEAALMQAVLEDALECFQKQFETTGRHVQRAVREAQEWLFSNDAHWSFSFVSVCAVLGLEPEAIRQELRRWSHSYPNTQQRKLPHARVVC